MTVEQGGTYYLGTDVRLFGRFFAVSFAADATTGIITRTKTLTDPSTVSLIVTPPTGSPTTYTYPATLTKLQTGVFYKDVTPNAAGTWTYAWAGTGTVTVVDKMTFVVRA